MQAQAFCEKKDGGISNLAGFPKKNKTHISLRIGSLQSTLTYFFVKSCSCMNKILHQRQFDQSWSRIHKALRQLNSTQLKSYYSADTFFFFVGGN